MGSGEFDTAGYGYASYVRNPMWRDVLFAPQYPESLGFFTAMDKDQDPVTKECYKASTLLMSSDDRWRRFFYCGGPGGDATWCE